MAAVYVINPFLGNINPGTDGGAKLYSKATAERKTKLQISQKNAKDILQVFKKDASNFGWSPLVGLIQVNVAGTEQNILTDSRRMTVEWFKKPPVAFGWLFNHQFLLQIQCLPTSTSPTLILQQMLHRDRNSTVVHAPK